MENKMKKIMIDVLILIFAGLVAYLVIKFGFWLLIIAVVLTL